MTTFFGRCGSTSAWSELMTPGRSTPGMLAGTDAVEPVATRMFLAVTVRPLMDTEFGPVTLA